jgi:hypothetical protein
MDLDQFGQPSQVDANTAGVTGYNLGDMLNMPSFYGGWSREMPSTILDMALTKVASRPHSILGRYFSVDMSSCRHPYMPQLRSAIGVFEKTTHVDPAMSLVRLRHTLVVHLRSGDSGGVEKTFLDGLRKVASRKNIKLVLFLCGVHTDTRYATNEQAMRKLHIDLGIIARCFARSTDLRFHVSMSTDDDLTLMSHATNLFVHKGGFSALGALVCEGTVFFTELMRKHVNSVEFRSLLRYPEYLSSSLVTQRNQILDRVARVQPSCCYFKQLSGHPITICSNLESFNSSKCWLLVHDDDLSLDAYGSRILDCSVRKLQCKQISADCLPDFFKQAGIMHPPALLALRSKSPSDVRAILHGILRLGKDQYPTQVHFSLGSEDEPAESWLEILTTLTSNMSFEVVLREPHGEILLAIPGATPNLAFR